MKSYVAKEADIKRAWHLLDAADRPLGRLATSIADVLRGKDKPTFTPHVDTGDFVVVVNAAKVRLTGRKGGNKIYHRYSGHRGGLKEIKASQVRERHPERLIELAVRGMMPKNNLSRKMMGRLKVYAGPDHPHQAQAPGKMEMKN
jgi:large subunit ribosomal protein L13